MTLHLFVSGADLDKVCEGCKTCKTLKRGYCHKCNNNTYHKKRVEAIIDTYGIEPDLNHMVNRVWVRDTRLDKAWLARIIKVDYLEYAKREHNK